MTCTYFSMITDILPPGGVKVEFTLAHHLTTQINLACKVKRKANFFPKKINLVVTLEELENKIAFVQNNHAIKLL